MDPYQTPDANLATTEQRPFQPVKAVLLGLCVSVIVAGLASMIEGVIFGVVMGANLMDQTNFETILVNSTGYLLTDVLMSALIFFWAGRVVGKRVPGKELIFGIVVTVLTLAIFTPLSIGVFTSQLYPIWYKGVSIVVVVGAIPLGAISCRTPKSVHS